MFTFYYQNIADKNTFQLFCSTRTNSKVVTLFARKVIAYFRFYYIHFEITGDTCNLLALSDVSYSQITSFPLNHIFFKSRHSCFKTAPFLVWIPGGYSIYPWVGRCGPAPHTLTLFKTKIADFPTLFKTEFRFLIPWSLRHLTRNQKKKFCCGLVRRT